jgi:hypothetical protein
LSGKPLGNQGAGDAGADDQRVAFQAFADTKRDRALSSPEPRRSAAAQIGLFGIVWIKNANGSPRFRKSAFSQTSPTAMRSLVGTKAGGGH